MSQPDMEASAPVGGLFEELSAAADAAAVSAPESAPESPSASESLGARLRRSASGKRDAPAAKGATRAKTTTTVREPPSRPGEFVESITTIYTAIGIGVSFRDTDGICGPAIVSNAEKIAVSWDELAQKDPSVRRALRTLTRGSAWGSVIAAHGAIALAIVSAHGPGIMPFPMAQPEPEDDQPTYPQPRAEPMSDVQRRTRHTDNPLDDVTTIENWAPGD